SGYSFSPAHLILIPFAIRAYIATQPELRNKWRTPEWLLVCFAIIQPFITFRNAPSFKDSLGALGLTALGILAYLAVYMAVCTPRRLKATARILLWLVLFNATFGVLAMLAHIMIHTNIGISTTSRYGNGVFGLSFEHDIFASTSAVGAIAFYVLWRERNPIFSPRISGIAFWICSAAMFVGLARGAWLGFGLAFLAVMIVPRTIRQRIAGVERVGIMLILAVLLGVGAAYVIGSSDQLTSAFDSVQTKMGDLVNINTATGVARLGETNQVLDDWKTHKLFGLGTGSYNQLHPLLNQTNYIGDIYLRALYETGLLGVTFLIGFLVWLFWPNKALLFNVGDLGPIARALTFGGAVLTVAYAATDATLLIWPWILFALVRAARVHNDREYDERRAAAKVMVGPTAPLEPVAPAAPPMLPIR
ncbi:MAG TPA: O-antigen ligase family protein, partial [Actinomycetota bacterium]|nr:O-antigen ligase family protein [Actinomycetota bacterium]